MILAAPTSSDAAGMLMSLTQGTASWFAIVPDMKNVLNGTPDNEALVQELRHAELVAGGITLGIGGLGSVFMHSWYPFIAAVLVIGLLAVAYHVALHSVPMPQPSPN